MLTCVVLCSSRGDISERLFDDNLNNCFVFVHCRFPVLAIAETGSETPRPQRRRFCSAAYRVEMGLKCPFLTLQFYLCLNLWSVGAARDFTSRHTSADRSFLISKADLFIFG